MFAGKNGYLFRLGQLLAHRHSSFEVLDKLFAVQRTRPKRRVDVGRNTPQILHQPVECELVLLAFSDENNGLILDRGESR